MEVTQAHLQSWQKESKSARFPWQINLWIR